MAQTGIAIGIDFGQLTTGLSAIMGMGQGMTNQKSLSDAIDRMARQSSREFGRIADKAGAAGKIAHVYEYGHEGSITGRLWHMNWQRSGNGTVGNVLFRKATIPTSVGAGIDPRLAAAASSAGRRIAGHYFPDKAEHLEDTQTLISEAGRQEYTTRTGGDVERPKVLVYIDRGGNVRFAKRRRRSNEFYNKFQEVFGSYWVGVMASQAQPKVQRAFTATAQYGAAEVNRSIRVVAGASLPRIPPGMSGVFATDRGRPFTGVRLRQTEVSRVQKLVEKRLSRELSNQWRK